MKIALTFVSAVVALSAFLSPHSRSSVRPAPPPPADVIVQATDLVLAARAVRSVGGTVTHELGIIDAVGAKLNAAQLRAIETMPGIRGIYPDGQVKTAGGKAYSTFYP